MAKSDDNIGPYTLISKLGRGAFGVVWLAEKRTQLATTKVALKLPNDEEIDIDAVTSEAGIWVEASGHPNVLPIIDADIYDGQVVIVSEYAPDGSLQKWIERQGDTPSIDVVVDIIDGVLSGLEHLHSKRIIHRDLKPDNILLQREIPRLADFGIARILKTSMSAVVSGTPVYMAPEAFDGKRSEQTDLWAVGVIFYQLLVGRLPFSATDMPSLLAAVMTREPEPIPDTIPLSLRNIVSKLLQKAPNHRYSSAKEARMALRAVRNSFNAPHVGQPRNITLPPTVAAIHQAVQPTLAVDSPPVVPTVAAVAPPPPVLQDLLPRQLRPPRPERYNPRIWLWIFILAVLILSFIFPGVWFSLLRLVR